MTGDPVESAATASGVKANSRSLLRGSALVAVVAGAAGSIVFTLRVGHRNPSHFLIALFAIWVLSPFVALVLADIASTGWSMLTRATLHWVMLVLALGSVAIYARVALGPPRPQPASFFLLVPFGSWLLMAIVVPIAGRISGRLSRDRKS